MNIQKENVNCLVGMKCPRCSSHSPFRIFATMSSWITVHDEGTDIMQGDVDWNDLSGCVCSHCGYQNSVAAFKDFTEKAQSIDSQEDGGNHCFFNHGDQLMKSQQESVMNVSILCSSDHSDHFTLLAFMDSDVVGYVDCSLQEDVVVIRYIHVNKECRRQGIARLMVSHLTEKYRSVRHNYSEVTNDGFQLLQSLSNDVRGNAATLSTELPIHAC